MISRNFSLLFYLLLCQNNPAHPVSSNVQRAYYEVSHKDALVQTTKQAMRIGGAGGIGIWSGILSAVLAKKMLNGRPSLYSIPATIGAGIAGFFACLYPIRQDLLRAPESTLRKLALLLGADINHKYPVTLITQDNKQIATKLTPLMITALQDRGPYRDLIDEKFKSFIADRNATNFTKYTNISLTEQDPVLGYTALHFALKNNNKSFAKILMFVGKSTNLTIAGMDGITPLDLINASKKDLPIVATTE